jgi:predicted  nucleic acid-binding Zn-ribbon protein
MHKHKCSLCGSIWEHGEELDNDMRAHECGTCGSHQFRVLIDRRPEAGPAGSAKPALSEALCSAKPFDRSTAVFSLDMQSVEARGVMPRLLEMVSRDPEPMVRLAVVEALRRGVVKVGGMQASGAEISGAEAGQTVPVLTGALADGYAEVRRAAALTLGSLGLAAGVAQAALTRSLSDGNPRVREAAAKALQTIQSSEGAHAQESPPRDTPSLHA